MDNLQWFKFSFSHWRMGKIQRCPEVTQARFINLCCLYWSKECVLSYEDAEIEIDEEHLNILIKKKVITNTDNHINISFLDEQFKEIESVKDERSKSGVIGNLKRWHPKVFKRYSNKEISLDEALNIITTLSLPDGSTIANPSQNIADKRREEKIRKDKNRVNNIEARKADFKKSLFPYLERLGKEELKSFYEYWTEHGERDRKMRFEKEKSFSIERRITTWEKNSNRFNKKEDSEKQNNLTALQKLQKQRGLL